MSEFRLKRILATVAFLIAGIFLGVIGLNPKTNLTGYDSNANYQSSVNGEATTQYLGSTLIAQNRALFAFLSMPLLFYSLIALTEAVKEKYFKRDMWLAPVATLSIAGPLFLIIIGAGGDSIGAILTYVVPTAAIFLLAVKTEKDFLAMKTSK